MSESRILASLTTAITMFTIAACSSGGGGDSSPPPPATDTTLPTVSSVGVPSDLTLNRTVTLTATASDNVGVTEVQFFVDDTLLGSDATSPYSFEWDTSTTTDGDHVLRAEARDAAGNVAVSADLNVSVLNVVQFLLAATGQEVMPPTDSQGSAQVDVTVNLATGEVSGGVTVSSITPTAAHIHDGFAGSNGGVVIGLDQDDTNPQLFTVPAAAALDAAGVERLLAGGLYVNVHTAAAPAGEIRGQLLTADFVLRFSNLSSGETVPAIDSPASGRAAITLNAVTGALVVQARITGLDSASAAHVHEAYAGNAGPVLVGLAQDGADPGRWFVEDTTLNDTGLDAFAAGRLYVNVHSPANPGGEIRGQVVPDGIEVIHTLLSGAQSVPPVDTTASGRAAMTLDTAGQSVTVHINTTGLADATGAHLHGAYGGVTGGVEVGLAQDGGNPAHWFVEEQALDAAQVEAIRAGATYVNVHTPAYASGEVRGQVIPGGIEFAFGLFDGSEVIPPINTDAAGALAVTVDPVAMSLVAHVNTIGADDAVAAHLHEAYAGASGGVAVPLVQDATTLSRWSAEVGSLTNDQLAAFREGRLYANVHTPAFPGGEIRGQVVPPPVEVLFATMGGSEEVPPVATAATGRAATTVIRDTGTMTVHVRTSGVDDATGAHVHSAYAGQNGGVAVGLVQDGADAAHWSVTEASLDAAALADYLEGRLYVNVHTPANAAGEIRAQIVPRDIQVVLAGMDGDQVVPAVVTAATGTVATTVDMRRRSLFAVVNGLGVDDATSAGIHAGGVGVNGAEVLPLQQSPTLVSQWSAMTEPLDATDFSSYRAGRLYAQVTTPAQAGGEIRGQIVPPDAALFDDQDPVVSLTSPGATVSGTVTLEADASDDQGVAIVRFLAGGVLIDSDTTAPWSVSWDTTSVPNGEVTLTAEAEDLAGNVGVSTGVNVMVDNAVATTLTEIQTVVFTPRCAGCHSGPTSGNLPGGMNLSTATDSHAALVNQPSLQVALDRVEPNDPDNSYLIRKLEGGPNIQGGQMPQGGPMLDAATIQMIRDWILDGAPNN